MNTLIKDALNQDNHFYLGEESALQQLNDFNTLINDKRKKFMGYPCNAAFRLEKFFEWWAQSSLSKSPLHKYNQAMH